MENIEEAAITFPQLNKAVLGFEARTTHGVKKLSDYKDR